MSLLNGYTIYRKGRFYALSESHLNNWNFGVGGSFYNDKHCGRRHVNVVVQINVGPFKFEVGYDE